MKARSKKTLAILLALAMVLSLLPGLTVFAGAEGSGTTYVKTDTIQAGGQYIIAYVDGGTAYCLDLDNVSTSTSSTSAAATGRSLNTSGDSITTDDQNLLWTLAASGSSWYIRPVEDPSYSLYMGNTDKLYLVKSSARAMACTKDEGESSYTVSYKSSSSSTTYYLNISGTEPSISFITNTATGASISFFELAISLSDAEVGVGQSTTLVPMLASAYAGSTVTWETDDENIATVDSTGTVIGVAAGSATITATIEGTTLSTSCTVTVIEPSTFVKVSNFEDGGEYILAYVDGGNAYCLDYDNVPTSSATAAEATLITDITSDTISTTDKSLIWIATASDSNWYLKPAAGSKKAYSLYMGGGGSLYLHGSTDARTMAYSSGIISCAGSSGTYYLEFEAPNFKNGTSGSQITLFKKLITPTGITLADATVAVGKAVALTPVLEPAGAAGTITWAVTSGDEYASLDENGVVTGVAAGTATVKATVDGTSLFASCAVTVTEPPRFVKADSLKDGGEYILAYVDGGTAYCLNPEQVSKESSISASAEGVGLDASGDSISPDNQNLLWTLEASGSSWYIRPVEDPSYSLYMGNTDKLYLVKSSARAMACTKDEGESSYTVSYKSSSSSTTYYLNISGTEPSISFITNTATGASISFFELAISLSDAEVGVGQSTTLVPMLASAYAGSTVTWETDDENIATVDSTGTVIGVAAGSATITATIEGTTLSTSCTVTVIEPSTFVKVSNFEDGGEYILAYVDGGNAYCLDYDNVPTSSATAAEATLITDITSDTISTTDKSLIWIATASDSNWYLKPAAGSKKAYSLYMGGGGSLYLHGSTDARTMAYSSGIISCAGSSGTYYLEFEAPNFKNGTSGSQITLFKKLITPTGITLADATVAVGKAVALTPVLEPPGSAGMITWAVTSGNDYASVDKNGVVKGLAKGTATVTATVNGISASCTVTVTGDSPPKFTYLGFTSDVHGSADTNLKNWFEHLPQDLDLEHMAYGGDYSYITNNTNTYVADFQKVIDVTNSHVGTGLGVYTAGNHEYYTNGQTATLPSAFPERGLLRIGEAVRADNYIIYCMGASGWNSSGSYPDADIETLRAYLETAPSDIPIFIVAHFPLHHISSRTITNADKMIDLLNAHPNTVFLWGHNHSQGSTEANYGTILTAGDNITYASGQSKAIQFTYACAGAMYSTQQSPYYGLVAGVSGDGDSVAFSYYDLSGNVPNVKNTGNPSLTHYLDDSGNADLRSLEYSLDSGATYTAVPGFSALTTSYEVTLPYGTPDGGSITLRGVCSSGDADITVNAGAVLSGGTATAGITVTAEDRTTTKTYMLHFTVSTSNSVFLGFTSDTHYATGKANNMDSWLTKVSNLYHTLDYMGVCGDIASTSSTSVAQYWQYVQSVIDTVNGHKNFVVNGGIYTTGNHEVYSGTNAGGNYAAVKGSNATAGLLTQTGEAARTSNYIIYCFGACNDGASSTVQAFTEAQISGLSAYLDSAPDNIPIFIMSHYPLHYDGHRVVERSEDGIAVLNGHPNAIFLWGHNHTDADDDETGYDNILKTGAVLTTKNSANGTSGQKTINFTYAPAGCMSDAEYYGSSAAVLGKGIIAEVADIEGVKRVTLTYYNLNGLPFTVAGKTTTATIDITAATSYIISWYTDGDGDVDDTTTVAHGDTPTHADGSKAADAQYTYTFSNWSPEISIADKNITYTAQFTSAVRKYAITWKNGNGDIIYTEDVPYGTTPVYDTSTYGTPTKNETDQYTYTFNGWDTTPAAVIGTTTYTAQFDSTVKKYTITWIDGNGTIIYTEDVPYGTTPVYDSATHGTPTKTATVQYTYSFDGWDNDPVMVTGTAAYTAQFTSAVRKYAITWKNGNGDIIYTEVVPYGTTPVYDASAYGIPTKTETAQYTYTFNDWSPEISIADKDITYTAQYTNKLRSYTVTWMNGSTILEQDLLVPYGTTPSYDGSTPTKEADETYTYTFSGWSPSLSGVTGPITYTAQFNRTPISTPGGGGNLGGGGGGVTEIEDTQTPKAAAGELPYYLDGSGLIKIFIGFSFDLDEDGFLKEGEYLAPAEKEILFAANSKTFADVSDGWAAPYIAFVTGREIFSGTSDTTFSPEDGMTRAMFATVLGRLYERSFGAIVPGTEHSFTVEGDCDYSDYYGKYLDWAAESGIITGYEDGTFRPNSTVTRQEMAVMIYRFAEFLGEDAAGGAELGFTDIDEIAGWAQEAAAYCSERGLITGRTDGRFDPNTTAERQDVAAIVTRFIKAVVS
jgi:uncharacterized protein YjdB